METQYSLLGYRIDLYFYDYEIAADIDENSHSDRNIGYEIKRQKAIEQELGCEFIRTDPHKNILRFDIFETIKERFRHIEQSSNQLTKKSTKKH